MTERRKRRRNVGIQGGWLENGEKQQWRHEENRGICLGVSDQTIRMSRRRRKIGAEAAGLRVRQDYLPSGGKRPCFVLGRRHKNNPLEKIGRQMDEELNREIA